MHLLLALALALLTAQQHHTSEHSFEDVDRWASEFEDPERDAWQRPGEVVTHMKLDAGDRVADIGAGTGYFARRFAEAVGDAGVVYAIDIEPNMLRYIAERAAASELGNVVPVLGTTHHPMLPKRSVDVVFICDTYHHIGNRSAYFEIVHRALTPDGRLVVVDFKKDEDIPKGPPEAMRLSKETIRAELEPLGFRLVADEEFLPYQYFLIFER